MAVYTSITKDELQQWLTAYDLGEVTSWEGISAGIENSNFYLSTSRADAKTGIKDFVLTIFERPPHNQYHPSAPIHVYGLWLEYLHDMGLPVPRPIRSRHQNVVEPIHNKAAMIASRLYGHQCLSPESHHYQALGHLLARLHQTCHQWQPTNKNIPHNPRGLDWWKIIIPKLRPHLPNKENKLIDHAENHLIPTLSKGLPLSQGIVHADLFRDNLLFSHKDKPTRAPSSLISGVFDFFFGGYDYYLFDLSVVINDWCSWQSHALDRDAAKTILASYKQTHSLPAHEWAYFPIMLQAAALRFYLSRRADQLFPREGIVVAHDPQRFYNILHHRLYQTSEVQALLGSF